MLAGPWQRLFEGRQLERDTLVTISSAGFRRTRSKAQLIRSPFLPVNSIVAGVATR
jgi:hypothetical protein